MQLISVVRIMLEQLNGRVVYVERAPQEFEPGKLSFPGGKVEAGQTIRDAVCEELQSEIGYQSVSTQYLFSQAPRAAKGKLYQEHFFRECMRGPVEQLRAGPEVSQITVLTLEQALANDNIAFSNSAAHLIARDIESTGVTNTSWLAANVQYTLHGTLPANLPIAASWPSTHTSDSRAELIATGAMAFAARTESFYESSARSKQRVSRWLDRHG